LQVLAKSVVDRECDDERRHAGSYSDNRDGGDDPNESLAAFCPKVSGSYEEFEAHEGSCWSLAFGNWPKRIIALLA